MDNNLFFARMKGLMILSLDSLMFILKAIINFKGLYILMSVYFRCILFGGFVVLRSMVDI